MNLKRQNDVLVLGLESVGKSLLIKQLCKDGELVEHEFHTNPTSGFDTT